MKLTKQLCKLVVKVLRALNHHDWSISHSEVGKRFKSDLLSPSTTHHALFHICIYRPQRPSQFLERFLWQVEDGFLFWSFCFLVFILKDLAQLSWSKCFGFKKLSPSHDSSEKEIRVGVITEKTEEFQINQGRKYTVWHSGPWTQQVPTTGRPLIGWFMVQSAIGWGISW